MAVSYADVHATILVGVEVAMTSGGALYGLNVFFPGDDRSTEDLDTWVIVGLQDCALPPSRLKSGGAGGVFAAYIYARIEIGGATDAYAREELAEAFRSAMEGSVFVLKDYNSGAGNSSLGYIEMLEAVYEGALIHDEGIYSGVSSIPFKIQET